MKPVRYYLAQAIATAICEPKLRLGRYRHDNSCDECGEPCSRYAMDKLDFPIDDLRPESSTAREKLRAMLNAEYVRVCLDCSVTLDGGGA